MEGATNVIAVKLIAAGRDDASVFFCDGRWLHHPTSDPGVWWANIPVEWPVVTGQFGDKLRGMVNRVPKETWEGAHSRARSWELKHWSSQNAYCHKQDKATSIDVAQNGAELLIGKTSKYRSPTTVGQLHNCILNYRSVMSR